MSQPVHSRRGLVLDAGMLIALDRGSRQHWARLRAAQREGILPVIPAPVVTQVWRSARQANLGRALKACAVEPTDDELAREAGELCAAAGTRDAVDAIVVATAARRGSTVATSDLDDLARLATHAKDVELNPV